MQAYISFLRSRLSVLMLAWLLLPCALSAPASNPQTSLHWKNCTVENFPFIATLQVPEEYISLLGSAPRLDCADLEVPVDWDHPDGKKFKLGMARYRASGTSKRLGTLVYNPGGPGGSGAETAMGQALGIALYSNKTTDHYDVIGFDPRGVGLSTPLKCDPKLYNARASTLPTMKAEFEKLVNSNKAWGEGCKKLTGDLFDHLDTISVARDLEALRAAIGEGPLNWLGLSYGTQIGQLYAQFYPNLVGRMVLDGNVDHSLSETSALLAEVTTYENTLHQFFNWCNTTATVEECPFHNKNLPRLFKNLIAKAKKNPIPAPGCKGDPGHCKSQASDEDILYNVQPMLVVQDPVPSSQSGWAGLAQALNEAMNGNATLLSSPLASDETDPLFPYIAVGCADWTHSAKSVSDIQYKRQMAINIAPFTQGISQSYLTQVACLGWPAEVADPPQLLDPKQMAKAPPVLMVNSLHDPETSYVWAEGLRNQIPSAVLLTRNGSGHTSYPLGGATTAVIDAFLVDGVLPPQNVVLDS